MEQGVREFRRRDSGLEFAAQPICNRSHRAEVRALFVEEPGAQPG